MSTQHKDQLDELLDVMQALRHPEDGCPWDLKQNWRTILPHTIEEVYEVADAIERENYDDLRSELGDLLFQIVFYAQLGREQNRFAWEAQKATERAERARRDDSPVRILDDIPATMPAMMRALKLQKRAGRVGFDWPNVAGSLAKIDEELNELRMSIAENTAQSAVSSAAPASAATEEELGDLLFSVVNTARKLDVDPERALRGANEKFIRRFQYIEDRLQASGRTVEQSSIDQFEALWGEAKAESEDVGR